MEQEIKEIPLEATFDPASALDEFARNFIARQQTLGPEFQKVLDENFRDLI